MNKAAVILAAGMGTRMKSATPKVLHKVAGLAMLGHVIKAARGAGAGRIVVVTSPDGQAVRDFAEQQGAQSVIQPEQLGTGHAARCAAPALADFDGLIAITYGDMPLLSAKTFEAAFQARPDQGLSITAFEAADPAAYGRVLLDAKGHLDHIVEYKDASETERATTLCNAGLLVADARKFFIWADQLKNNNAQSEYYLTDIPILAKQDGLTCAVARTDEIEVMGVNSRAELALAEQAMQQRLRKAALANGVGMTAPETVYLCHDTVLASDVQIDPFVVFGPKVVVQRHVHIKGFSHIEGAVIEQGALIGPYARLRPGAEIGPDAHIGNFVEVKKAKIEKGAKANHLTYIGDAIIGAGANIGAGTITCNYDGFGKYLTEIGEGAFIGSNTSLVAPVKIGAGAITGAGSTISKNVPDHALVVTRAALSEKEGWAANFRHRKQAEKAKKGSN